MDKTRITIALSANSDGSKKRPAFYIGRARRLHCFKGKDGEELGFYYRNNKKAWMTRALNTEWIKAFDRDMRSQGRDVLLLVNNASSHDLESGELTNITVQKLPPNTTSHLQPMDMGIISCCKGNYRERHLELACNRAGETMPDAAPERKSIYYVGQLQGMTWSDGSWGDDSQETAS
ncbi:hypothetical protein PF005_g18302 [Phytophthora fragariae]|uniref:DDE-1 domain-containing protein n=2 Tax=Phytophthora fragariae TaxID=53985 RepID=A0A6A3X0T5_9STRA|nr:hypothetical protein PF009_g19068 [Phytophthora fragariae]KAE9093926.1 hypothetical protein PF007_g17949 [Phytophthora fragariae]KAE9123845.1 hypothetical protein PF006_g17336 [Phytophthora fragariae]KAE9192851.1 hypothetical protein PF005_g18302 [Phytophthora fragariae]KAE9205651.1 hypothetical protein PF004_g17521 [Phytophthora fragariae]